MKKMVIGLTGGIASGKSVVSAYLGKKPFVTVIDADLISREVFSDPSTAQKIAVAFPECVSDGVPERNLLRSVFSDENKTKTLNGIMHPAIIETCEKRIEEASSRIVVLVVPLLFETRMDKLCDLTIAVVCDRKVRIKRLTERDNIDEAILLNLNGTIYGSKIFGEVMKAQKSGIIINISSVCARHCWQGWSVYAAAKAGVLNFTKGLYVEILLILLNQL